MSFELRLEVALSAMEAARYFAVSVGVERVAGGKGVA
jgi:hypothetical protein